MKLNTAFYICLISLFTFNCSNNDEDVSDLNEDQKQLNEQFEEIFLLATSTKCIDSTDWSYIAYGARACGGPQGFIPYYLKTDTTLLFSMLNSYEANERDYNQRWNITSICTVPNEPTGIKCENENPVLVYD